MRKHNNELILFFFFWWDKRDILAPHPSYLMMQAPRINTAFNQVNHGILPEPLPNEYEIRPYPTGLPPRRYELIHLQAIKTVLASTTTSLHEIFDLIQFVDIYTKALGYWYFHFVLIFQITKRPICSSLMYRTPIRNRNTKKMVIWTIRSLEY